VGTNGREASTEKHSRTQRDLDFSETEEKNKSEVWGESLQMAKEG